jgi:hypothetical protein
LTRQLKNQRTAGGSFASLCVYLCVCVMLMLLTLIFHATAHLNRLSQFTFAITHDAARLRPPDTKNKQAVFLLIIAHNRKTSANI